MAMTLKYRADIDGLRAIAVIPVLLYHAGVTGFSGGYVGVDVFFVVSGYLITKIILADIESGEFSIWRFYERRVRRIFPALFPVLFFALIFGYLILLPEEFEDFGKSLFYTTFFVSNIYFMDDVGYFAAPAETKPLLHIWSLAVEEQFYIFFPIFLYLLSKFSKKVTQIFIIFLSVVSFIVGVWVTHFSQDLAFYLAPVRAWELFLGSVLVFVRAPKQSNRLATECLSAIGIFLIAGSVFFYTDATLFPGVATVPPCLGTALIIYAGERNSPAVNGILGQDVFRCIGLISYSLYLWHWPVLIYLQLYSLTPVTPLQNLLALAGVFGISGLSWKFIEQPFRTRKYLKHRLPLFTAGAGVMASTALCGFLLGVTDGIPDRLDRSIRQIAAVKRDIARASTCASQKQANGGTMRVCRVGALAEDPATFLVWGDSHARALLPAIEASASRSGETGLFIGRAGCLPFIGADPVARENKNCLQWAESTLDFLEANKQIRQVILIARWATYAMGEPFGTEKRPVLYLRDRDTDALSLDENKRVISAAFERTITRLVKLHKDVFVIYQIPATGRDIPATMARARMLDRTIELRTTLEAYQNRQSFVFELFESAKQRFPYQTLSTHERFCDDEYCNVSKGGLPIYRDSHHVSRTYASEMADLFDPIFSKID